MTGLLDGLERKGLVKHLAHPEDHRKVSIRLTDTGRHILVGMLPDYYSRIAKLILTKKLGAVLSGDE